MTNSLVRGETATEPPPEIQTVALDVVIPVYNEETDLERCVRRLHEHLDAHGSRTRAGSPSPTTRAPTRTLAVAARLAAEFDGVRVVHLDEKGRGRALRAVWVASDADGRRVHGRGPVHRPQRPAAAGRAAAVRPLRPRHRHPGSPARRGWCAEPKREFISRGYNLILRGALRARFSDAQCGFKAIRTRRGAAAAAAGRRTPAGSSTPNCWSSPSGPGLRIHEVPVDWVDDPDSTRRPRRDRARRPQGRAGGWAGRWPPALARRSPRCGDGLGREPLVARRAARDGRPAGAVRGRRGRLAPSPTRCSTWHCIP